MKSQRHRRAASWDYRPIPGDDNTCPMVTSTGKRCVKHLDQRGREVTKFTSHYGGHSTQAPSKEGTE